MGALADKDVYIAHLAKPDNLGLLLAFLAMATFSYRDLEDATDKSYNTLTTKISRWKSRGLDLLECAGVESSSGRGPRLRRWRLKPDARFAVRKAVTLLEAGSNDIAVPKAHSLASVSVNADLLQMARDPLLPLSSQYRNGRKAQLRFQQSLEFLKRADPYAIGFLPSDFLLGRIAEYENEARRFVEQIKKLITKKHDELRLRENAFANDCINVDAVATFFRYMPRQSITGFGGALSARGAQRPTKPFDSFVARVVHSNDGAFKGWQRDELIAGFSHSLGEIIQFADIVPLWRDTALSVFDGAEACTVIAEQPTMREIAVRGRDIEGLDDAVRLRCAEFEKVSPGGERPRLPLVLNDDVAKLGLFLAS